MHNSVLFPILLSASTFLSYSTLAACTANPDCSALGYTKTSCASGDLIIKCPFDTAKVQCIPQTCETIGKKTCGNICVTTDGCCSDTDCATGQSCYNNICKDITCAVGDIYYSDKTCFRDLISSKTPIGVVGKISNGGKNGIVLEKNFTMSSSISSACRSIYTNYTECTHKVGYIQQTCREQYPASNPTYDGIPCSEWLSSAPCNSYRKQYQQVRDGSCLNKNVSGVTGWKNAADVEGLSINSNDQALFMNNLQMINGTTKLNFQSSYLWKGCSTVLDFNTGTTIDSGFRDTYMLSYIWCYIEF